MQASCATSTWKQYENYFKKWNEYCSSECVSPPFSINIVLEFLVSLYNMGLGYSSLNTARSALSILIGKVDGVMIGSHPLVVRFIKGVANKRPPKSRYAYIWDVDKVLDMFKNWEPNEKLTLRQLSMKVAALISLASGQRLQTLSLVRVQNVNVNTNSIDIIVTDRLKTSKPGSTHTMSFPKFSDPKICVYEVITNYLERTKMLRNGEFMFISTHHPYKNANSETIGNWLKCVLKSAGIDKCFTAHSYRHASVSKANSAGTPIDLIYRAAGWSRSSNVFGRFYNRPVVDITKFACDVFKK